MSKRQPKTAKRSIDLADSTPAVVAADSIKIAALTPNAEMALVDKAFLSALTAAEAEVMNLKIKDDATLQAASNLQSRLTKAGKLLEYARVKLKQPFLDKGSEIDTAAKGPRLRIEAAKRWIGEAQIKYADEVAESHRKAEAKRLADLKALEDKRIAEEKAEEERAAKEAADLAASLAAKAKLPPEALDLDEVESVDLDGDDTPALVAEIKTETQKQIELLSVPVSAPITKAEGTAFRTELVIVSCDPLKMPDMFVTRVANEKAVRATYCAGYKEGQTVPVCPGVVFKVSRTAISTGKNPQF